MTQPYVSFRFADPGPHRWHENHTHDVGTSVCSTELPEVLAGLVRLVREDEATWAQTPWPKGSPLLREQLVQFISGSDVQPAGGGLFPTGQFLSWAAIEALLAAGGSGDPDFDRELGEGLAHASAETEAWVRERYTGKWLLPTGALVHADRHDRSLPGLAAALATFSAEDAALLRLVLGLDLAPFLAAA